MELHDKHVNLQGFQQSQKNFYQCIETVIEEL